MKIFSKSEIEESLCIPEVLRLIEEGFISYSKKEAVVPPVATLHFNEPPGDCHIKYGYSKKESYYVIKIASGFSENPVKGLPTGNGLVILFDKDTGVPVYLFQDEGYLTDIRTAAAGAIAAKYLAPKVVSSIGIVGTGVQALLQVKFLSYVTDCKKVLVWGRNLEKAQVFKLHPELKEYEFEIEVAKDLDELTSRCNLIVTTTSSTTPLIYKSQIQKGTHITGIGSDDEGKREIDPYLFTIADCIVVDSKSQCEIVGDSSYPLKMGLINSGQIFELGEIILEPSLGRVSDEEITVADLTGVAIQDLQVALAAVKSLS